MSRFDFPFTIWRCLKSNTGVNVGPEQGGVSLSKHISKQLS
jgi:hypothetical protein